MPLQRYLERPVDSSKLRVVLHTPSDDVPLAILYLNLNKVGYRLDSEEDLTQTGLTLFQSLSNNLVA